MKRILYISIAVFATLPLLFSCTSNRENNQQEEQVVEEVKKEPTIIYDIVADDYTVEKKEVQSGESWSTILDSYGITVLKVLRLEELAKDICPLSDIKAGNKYTTFTRRDSVATRLDYLVYENSREKYTVFSFVGDSVAIREGQREVTTRRMKSTAVITSSLWGAIMENNLPYALAAEMEDIYEWTVDFFGIQEGDTFTVIYDEKLIDTTSIGIGRIWGAKFTHRKKDLYAIPFEIDGKVQYWEKDGASLRKQFLKAPLKFTRISSGYSNARLHPVLKVYRPHHGIDYAAPIGTEVRAVADGVVIKKGYSGGAGHMVKIKHSGDLVSGYLHLSKYGKGIAVGSRVSQGQIIGYVGSTGRSTGPHLDFRLWRGGKPINPANVTQNHSEPIEKKYRDRFNSVKERVIAELEGDVPDSMKLTSFDNI
ncbi:MAG: peptidoglycan DD-metalloendopeptidase family protein [Alistipes sp.]|nr:peptidoglycan DD-metalloendopeptidase family protein [Alistipes sp.]